MALLLCFCSQASSHNLFSSTFLLALLICEGVESLEGAAEASFYFFLPLPFGTSLGDGSLGDGSFGAGSLIIMPL